jgi:chromosome segregation ATPase
VWLLAVVGCVIVAVRRRPKVSAAPLKIAAPKAPVGVSSDNVRAFTEAYEEKSRIASELKSLDDRARKGKIPRRRYKVQRRALEVRSDALSRNIVDLKRAFRGGGGLYADLVRQLDIAEAELDEVETDIESVETRQRRGELSLEEYKKQLVDCQRRREKAETTVNGILLRLREEIR